MNIIELRSKRKNDNEQSILNKFIQIFNISTEIDTLIIFILNNVLKNKDVLESYSNKLNLTSIRLNKLYLNNIISVFSKEKNLNYYDLLSNKMIVNYIKSKVILDIIENKKKISDIIDTEHFESFMSSRKKSLLNQKNNKKNKMFSLEESDYFEIVNLNFTNKIRCIDKMTKLLNYINLYPEKTFNINKIFRDLCISRENDIGKQVKEIYSEFAKIKQIDDLLSNYVDRFNNLLGLDLLRKYEGFILKSQSLVENKLIIEVKNETCKINIDSKVFYKYEDISIIVGLNLDEKLGKKSAIPIAMDKDEKTKNGFDYFNGETIFVFTEENEISDYSKKKAQFLKSWFNLDIFLEYFIDKESSSLEKITSLSDLDWINKFETICYDFTKSREAKKSKKTKK